MKNDKELARMIKAQMKLEKEQAEKLRTLEQRVDSVAAKLLLHEMQLDTKKHAEILGEILKVIDSPKSFWDYSIHIDADKRAVKMELGEHIKAEETMLHQIEEEAKRTSDEALKLLLDHFAEDEKKHHKYLKTILSKTYKMEL